MSLGTASKKAGKGVYKATVWLAVEMCDAPRKERIRIIDKELERLQKERVHLATQLIKDDSQ